MAADHDVQTSASLLTTLQAAFEMSTLSVSTSPLVAAVRALPRWKLAVLAGSLSFPLLLTPVIYARFGEFLVHFKRSPLRAIAEVGLSAASAATLLTEALGFNLWQSVFPKLTPRQRVAIAAPVLALSALSLSRGMSPSHGPLRTMVGKLAVLTGGTNGIGLELARKLVTQGANLVLIVRNAARAEQVVDELKAINWKCEITVLVADQDDLTAVSKLDIQRYAKPFEQGIDLLVLNAGAFPENKATFTASGYEQSITAMHLSHALITKMCWPLLNKNARVVISSSIAHDACPSVETIFDGIADGSDIQPINQNGYARYSRAKFANALFARQLGRLADLDHRHITVVSFHPGAVATNIWTSPTVPKFLSMIVLGVCSVLMRSSAKGAATLIDAAVGAHPLEGQDRAPNGSYYISSALVDHGFRFNPLLHSATAGQDFWELTEHIITPFSPILATWTSPAQ